MATTPEGWVKKAVKELLEYWDVYYHMPVQNGMGKPSLDFICCMRGVFVAIEAKAPDKDLTPRQRDTALDISRAHGHVKVVAGFTDFVGLWQAFYHLVDVPMYIPTDLRAKWERYFRNAGCKDVDQHAT